MERKSANLLSAGELEQLFPTSQYLLKSCTPVLCLAFYRWRTPNLLAPPPGYKLGRSPAPSSHSVLPGRLKNTFFLLFLGTFCMPPHGWLATFSTYLTWKNSLYVQRKLETTHVGDTKFFLTLWRLGGGDGRRKQCHSLASTWTFYRKFPHHSHYSILL